MSNLENQIKHIESNICLREKKIQILEKEIKEVKNVYYKTYNKLIKQEEVLFKKKMKSILWDLKVNKLKKENGTIQKEMELTNKLLHSNFTDLKYKKCKTKIKKKKLEEITALIKTEHLKKQKEDTIPLQIVQTFLEKKKEHNNNLETFLTKKNDKITNLENKNKKLETDIFSLCQEIGILNEELIYNLNKIKYFVHQEIDKFPFRRQQLNINKSTLIASLNMITNILEKEKKESHLFNEKYNNIFKKQQQKQQKQQKQQQQQILYEKHNSSSEEMNVHLGLHTKEFLELENFY